MSQTVPVPRIEEVESPKWAVGVRSIFGRNLSKKRVEKDVISYLQEWVPTYISEQEVQEGLGRGFYAEIQTFTRTNQDIEKFPEDSLPAIVVVSPGLFEEPIREGDGKYRARFSVTLGVICSGNDYEATMDMTADLTAAVRMCMLQAPSLNKPPEFGYRGNKFLTERYDDVPPVPGGMNRTVGVGSLLFWVEARNVVSTNAGPVAEHPFPDPDTPYPTDPVVDEIIPVPILAVEVEETLE